MANDLLKFHLLDSWNQDGSGDCWKFTSFMDQELSKRSFQVPTSFGSFGSPEV